jgi:hypothetical protein
MGSAHGMCGGGERRGAYRVLVEKPDRKSALGRPRHSWIILKWIFTKQFGGHGLDYLAQDWDSW